MDAFGSAHASAYLSGDDQLQGKRREQRKPAGYPSAYPEHIGHRVLLAVVTRGELYSAGRAPVHQEERSRRAGSLPEAPVQLLLSRIVRRVVNARFEFPTGRRLHVRIFVVPIVFDLVLISA